MIRAATVSDAPAIAGIYNHYVEKTIITFEEQPVAGEEMRSRIAETLPALPWLVAEDNGQVIGYACASRWKSRCAYRFSVEGTVYLHHGHVGKGVGSELFRALLDDLRLRSLHSVIAGIALPNEASVALHEKFGFEKVAHFREVGRKFEKWIDVGYWELLLS